MCRRLCHLSILLVSLLGLGGCAPSGVEVVSETDEKQYQLGQDYKNQGRMEEALGAFERVTHLMRIKHTIIQCFADSAIYPYYS